MTISSVKPNFSLHNGFSYKYTYIYTNINIYKYIYIYLYIYKCIYINCIYLQFTKSCIIIGSIRGYGSYHPGTLSHWDGKEGEGIYPIYTYAYSGGTLQASVPGGGQMHFHNTFKNEFYSTILIIITIEINNDECVPSPYPSPLRW
jgi:hypothetical protein